MDSSLGASAPSRSQSGEPRYLSNMTPRDGLPELVAEAARRSGQDVRLCNHPMPPEARPENAQYDYRGALSLGYVSICGYDGRVSYSPFWRAYEAIEDEQEAARAAAETVQP